MEKKSRVNNITDCEIPGKLQEIRELVKRVAGAF